MDGLVTHVMMTHIRAQVCSELEQEERMILNATAVVFVASAVASITTVVSWLFHKLTKSSMLYLRDTFVAMKLVLAFAIVYPRVMRHQNRGNPLFACPYDVWDSAAEIAVYMVCLDVMLLTVTMALRWGGVRDRNLVASAFVIICATMLTLFKEETDQVMECVFALVKAVMEPRDGYIF